jgi:hypothetical protein
MNSERDQLQGLITEIDGVLRKMSSRMAWWMSGDTRQVLERVRNYLVSLEEQIPTQPRGSEQSSEGGKMIVSGVEKTQLATSQVSAEGENQTTAAWQALVGEMNTLRSEVMQPIISDLAQLRQEKESLIKEIRQLELRRQHDYSLAQQQANQQKVISEFLHVLMGRLQDTLTQSVTQFLTHMESQGLAYEKGDRTGRKGIRGEARSSLHPLLDPQERLEHLRMLQAQSDELLVSLDANLRVIFDAVQRNVHAYQDSLLQELEKMQRLGQQNEVMFSRLVYHLAQELGQDPSIYMESSLKLTEADLKANPSENQETQDTLGSLSETNQTNWPPGDEKNLQKTDSRFGAIASQSVPKSPQSSSLSLENDDIETLLNTEMAPPMSSEPPPSVGNPESSDQEEDLFAGLDESDLEATVPGENPDLSDRSVADEPDRESEVGENVRSLDSLTDLIHEIDPGELSSQETESIDLSASTDDSYRSVAPEEDLLLTEDPLNEESDSELSIDTNTLQQLSEDLLNLESFEDQEDSENSDQTENWGWGEEIDPESPVDNMVESETSDLPTTTNKTPTAASPAVSDRTEARDSEEDDEDIFGNLLAEEPIASPEEPATTAASPAVSDRTEARDSEEDDEDIFGNLLAEEPIATPEETTATTAASPAVSDRTEARDSEEDDEDIFGNLLAEEPIATPEEPATTAASPAVSDRTEARDSEEDDEDIFGNLLAEEPIATPEEPATTAASPAVSDRTDAPDSEEDDEDIFGNLLAEEPIATPEEPATTAASPAVSDRTESPEGEEDDEDIFGNLLAEEPIATPEEPATTAASPAVSDRTETPDSEEDDEDIFGNLLAEEPIATPEEPATTAASPAVSDRTETPDSEEDDEDIFGNLLAEEPIATPEEPATTAASPAVSDRTETPDSEEDDEDIFGNLLAEESSSSETQAKSTENLNQTANSQPTKNYSVTSEKSSDKSSQKSQTPSKPPIPVSKSQLENLTLDEIFADLVAASPPPENTNNDDWVEIDHDQPLTSPVTEEQPEPNNSSVDDFFADFDDSSGSLDETSTDPDSESDDLSDLDSWLLDPASELELESDDSSTSDLDDFFAELTTKTSIPVAPSDEDLFS